MVQIAKLFFNMDTVSLLDKAFAESNNHIGKKNITTHTLHYICPL